MGRLRDASRGIAGTRAGMVDARTGREKKYIFFGDERKYDGWDDGRQGRGLGGLHGVSEGMVRVGREGEREGRRARSDKGVGERA